MEAAPRDKGKESAAGSNVNRHPSFYLPEYRGHRRWLVIHALAQMVWAVLVFYFSMKPNEFLRPSFPPGAVYAFYSFLHAGATVIGVVLGNYLASKAWLRAAALGNAVPGFGVFFGLFQIYPAWKLYRNLGQKHWDDFFQWRDRTSRKKLTP